MRRHIVITLLVPLFFVGFSLSYRPFEILENCDFGTFPPYVQIILMGCILLATLLLSRIIFFLVEHFSRKRLSWWTDMIWCASEVIVAAFFVAMYCSLFSHKLYFLCLGTVLQQLLAILIYPYVIISLTEALLYKDKPVKYSNKPESVIRFLDEHKKLKLIVPASSVLYIKADDNSVKIFYLESGKIKEFVLRASMRSLEAIADKYHLIRCQRSYYVNPSHVNILRKDNEGFIFAVLDVEGAAAIPVSKTYYDKLASIL
ncbi:MAG: LytTR family DNA-binding domain-containing protein [Candidatus Cryptobacteroides sp.]|nr:LytTR family DNA-binding domain-containing protein [Candidatus Cryptobacteroides sp.]